MTASRMADETRLLLETLTWEWVDREALYERLVPRVAPGRALRKYQETLERLRDQKAVQDRKPPLPRDAQQRSGARALLTRSLHSLKVGGQVELSEDGKLVRRVERRSGRPLHLPELQVPVPEDPVAALREELDQVRRELAACDQERAAAQRRVKELDRELEEALVQVVQLRDQVEGVHHVLDLQLPATPRERWTARGRLERWLEARADADEVDRVSAVRSGRDLPQARLPYKLAFEAVLPVVARQHSREWQLDQIDRGVLHADKIHRVKAGEIVDALREALAGR